MTFPYCNSPELLLAAQNVRVAFFDVDGVLTDGGLFFSETGRPSSASTRWTDTAGLLQKAASYPPW